MSDSRESRKAAAERLRAQRLAPPCRAYVGRAKSWGEGHVALYNGLRAAAAELRRDGGDADAGFCRAWLRAHERRGFVTASHADMRRADLPSCDARLCAGLANLLRTEAGWEPCGDAEDMPGHRGFVTR